MMDIQQLLAQYGIEGWVKSSRLCPWPVRPADGARCACGHGCHHRRQLRLVSRRLLSLWNQYYDLDCDSTGFIYQEALGAKTERAAPSI